MAGDAVYITKERMESMQAELAELKGPGRKYIAQQIADARSHGDLSENADYDAAKHAQELHEIRDRQAGKGALASADHRPGRLPGRQGLYPVESEAAQQEDQ